MYIWNNWFHWLLMCTESIWKFCCVGSTNTRTFDNFLHTNLCEAKKKLWSSSITARTTFGQRAPNSCNSPSYKLVEDKLVSLGVYLLVEACYYLLALIVSPSKDFLYVDHMQALIHLRPLVGINSEQIKGISWFNYYVISTQRNTRNNWLFLLWFNRTHGNTYKTVPSS